MRIIFIQCFCFLFFFAHGQITKPEVTEVWEPEPRIVSVDQNTMIPSDAIVLFDGTDLSQWKARGKDEEAKWIVDNGQMKVNGTGDIMTKEKFGSCQLHIEWRTPDEIVGESQGRGNSGVFFQERYEVQILDSYKNRSYSNGQAASVYKQHIPLVNASQKPGVWQSYDIIFTAPIFNEDGHKISSGYITVLHNGVIVQNHVELYGTTEYIGMPKNIKHGDGSIVLQDHGNPMRFRNIWVRSL